jgi:hypothetical protein
MQVEMRLDEQPSYGDFCRTPQKVTCVSANNVSRAADYPDTNPETVRATVRKDLPAQRKQVHDLRATMPSEPSQSIHAACRL